MYPCQKAHGGIRGANQIARSRLRGSSAFPGIVVSAALALFAPAPEANRVQINLPCLGFPAGVIAGTIPSTTALAYYGL
ncbi:MAG: hypothetical protein BJ554DRAFT_1997 [Olpidium bornovanus]|uniref:Uncharacterized protein n=1 Tax=Olpidium bornovanus TaxID=278681 RepID=A0A8H8DGZ8_9FUNG|nr:MAG: hypothetical protein BJ554DRAFT_1997 [Olpidium bornovanus]